METTETPYINHPHLQNGSFPDEVELTVVMPCLNEVDTLENCIRKAQKSLSEHRIKGEYEDLNQGRTGMEFATEMIIKSGLFKVKIAEVLIPLHLDGRKSHAPHLKTFRDGWRTLRFF